MTPTVKEAQRAELHRAIWRIANDLRTFVDGWDSKSYLLGTQFYRYISENLATRFNRVERTRRSPARSSMIATEPMHEVTVIVAELAAGA